MRKEFEVGSIENESPRIENSHDIKSKRSSSHQSKIMNKY
jgi:hypothetical protein